MPRKIHRRRDTEPQEGLEKYGEAVFADPVNKKYPIDTPGRIKAGGEIWTALPYDENVRIAPGETVEIFEIRGATAYVHPVGTLEP